MRREQKSQGNPSPNRRCLVCGKHVPGKTKNSKKRPSPNDESEHHFWHPKGLFLAIKDKARKTFIIHKHCHTEYNSAFDDGCRDGIFKCRTQECRFSRICCYFPFQQHYYAECVNKPSETRECDSCDYQILCHYIAYNRYYKVFCSDYRGDCESCQFNDICRYSLWFTLYNERCEGRFKDREKCNCQYHRYCLRMRPDPERR